MATKPAPTNVVSLPPICSTEVDSVTPDRWDDYLSLFADGSIYQSWAYGAVSWGERNLSHLVLKERDDVVAMAQLRIVRVPGLRRGVGYVRWGPLWRRRNEPVNLERLRRVTEALVLEYVERRKLLLRILPNVFREDAFGQAACQLWAEAGLVSNSKIRPYHTIRLDLSPSLGDLRKAFDAKWRNKLSGAERNGLSITEGTGDDLYSAFMAVYQEMMARKQFETTVDVGEFGRIQQVLPASHKMQIFLCQKDGVVLNGLVVTHIGDSAIYLLGATSNEGMKAKGAYLLHWQAIQWLKRRGVTWYELGGINPEINPGVYEFKKGFSGQEVIQLGRLECCQSALSAFVVRMAEWWSSRRTKQRHGIPGKQT